MNETLFSSLAHVHEVLSFWKDYNTVRPHSSLGDLTPAACADRRAPDTRRDAALHRRLHAPSRCFTEPNGSWDSAHGWIKEGAQVNGSKPQACAHLWIEDREVR